MRFPALCLCLLVALCAGFVTGCITEQPNQCPCVDCPCDADCCPECCPCLGGGCCVDGVCLPRIVDEREATSDMPAYLPDPATDQPREQQNAGAAEQLSNQRNKPREGVFQCMRCRRGHVGAAWHTLHTPNGGAATWLCVRCWSETNHAERMQYLHQYFDVLKAPESQRRAFIVAMNGLGSDDSQQ